MFDAFITIFAISAVSATFASPRSRMTVMCALVIIACAFLMAMVFTGPLEGVMTLTLVSLGLALFAVLVDIASMAIKIRRVNRLAAPEHFTRK